MIPRQSTATCAGCSRFPLDVAAKSGGWAVCTVREQRQEWSERACVLFQLATNREQRKQLVIQLKKESDAQAK